MPVLGEDLNHGKTSIDLGGYEEADRVERSGWRGLDCAAGFSREGLRAVDRAMEGRLSDGFACSPSTVTRALREGALALPAEHQRQRRRLGKARRAAFARQPTGPNQVSQLDFTDLETTAGGVWRIAGCRGRLSRYEHPFHISPTANRHEAIDALMLARHLEEHRRTHSELRPHEALAWSCPAEVH